MTITILTAGSRGDVQPYLALGQQLEKSGRHVRFVTFENFRSLVESAGLEIFPIQGDVSMAAGSDEMKMARTSDNPLKLILSFNKLKSLILDMHGQFYDACRDSEAIVYHPGPAMGFFAAQHLGIPGILATPFPMSPTREFPSLAFYTMPRFGSGFNLLTHKLFETVMWSTSRDPIRKFLIGKFGKFPSGFACPYPQQTTPLAPTVISCSRHVFPRPADWPEHVHCDGYWFMDDETTWKPPSDLQAFLKNGVAPLYVGFGSIGDPREAQKTTHIVLAALRQSGQRGILATGWSGMSRVEDAGENIHILESAPHGWLFPQMAAVVHHGGAGTTAAALRAGIPQVIVPSGLDQGAWARRAFELGVSAKPLPRKNLNTERLAEGIRQALQPEARATAKIMGEKIRAERGAELAAQVILDCIEHQKEAHR